MATQVPVWCVSMPGFSRASAHTQTPPSFFFALSYVSDFVSYFHKARLGVSREFALGSGTLQEKRRPLVAVQGWQLGAQRGLLRSRNKLAQGKATLRPTQLKETLW